MVRTRGNRGNGQRQKRAGKEPTPAQTALEVTWVLKGKLKSERIAFLKIGALLERVRDEKLYEALSPSLLADYAEQRLALGQASLYRYLQVYDWVKESHPEWLAPQPKGFYSRFLRCRLSHVGRDELKRTDLSDATRAALEALRQKGLEGKLRQKDLDPYRKHHTDEGGSIKAFLAKLQNLRERGAELSSMPAEVLADLDAAIGVCAMRRSFTTRSSPALGPSRPAAHSRRADSRHRGRI